LHGFLASLADCDPILAKWYQVAGNRYLSRLRPVHWRNHAALLRIIRKGRHRRDIGREVIERLGFTVDVWNGARDDRAVGLNITCGLHYVSPNPRGGLSNSVLIYLPRVLGRLERPEVMSRVLEAVITHWEPERAGVMRREGMEAREFDARYTFVDWMVYTPKRIDRVPEPSVVVPVESGTIIVVTPSPPLLDREDDQEAIRAIERIVLE
jgi:hypothetical protein